MPVVAAKNMRAVKMAKDISLIRTPFTIKPRLAIARGRIISPNLVNPEFDSLNKRMSKTPTEKRSVNRGELLLIGITNQLKVKMNPKIQKKTLFFRDEAKTTPSPSICSRSVQDVFHRLTEGFFARQNIPC